MDETECTQMGDLFTSYAPFHIVLLVQVILCLTGGLLCIPVISKGYHLYSYLFKTGCQVLVSNLFCDIARGPSTMSIIIVSALHLFLCVERIAARCYGIEYDKKRARLGPLLIGISTMYTFLVYGWILSPENFSYQVPFCTPGNKYTGDRSSFVFKFSPILDVASLVFRPFDLNVNFSLSENNSACLMLWPFSVLHLIAQIPFLLMAAYLSSLIPSDSLMLKRMVLQICYIYPLYIITGCLVLLYIMRKIREQRRNKIRNILRDGNDERLIHEIYSKGW
ncbi:unnamed protein product, partial [Mesorhabditis belari]|uniref:Uncharacterized protein n=1 Tax=Mesorhabditis belari TaxID=2138241 RepID=A0AAF3EPW5_9BILA